MDERNKLLMKLTACKFAQYELVLFLDTHPNCVEAMQALNMHRANAIKLKDEYECKYPSRIFLHAPCIPGIVSYSRKNDGTCRREDLPYAVHDS